MSREEFEEGYPVILAWIEQTLARHQGQGQPVSSLGFKRLPHYYSRDLLSSARVVYPSDVPVPPLRELGLGEFSDFEELNPAGITYLDTFFCREEMRGNEALHFHELVHVVQWRLLGPKNFLASYADGLSRFGYRESPLEVMAYRLEERFLHDPIPFSAERVVKENLRFER